jgi:hypothetical protein
VLELEAARAHIEKQLAPAASSLLGSAAARPWLAQRWRWLATQARSQPFGADTAAVHAAALWLHAQAWSEAADAVQGIESWRRIPIALGWMARARWHLQGADAAWPLLAELCWLAPTRARALALDLPDRNLRRLCTAFEANFEADDWALWPAWLLVEQPLLSGPLSHAQVSADGVPERCFNLLLSLLHLERQGRHAERVEQRRQLQQLCAPLFKAYMATR